MSKIPLIEFIKTTSIYSSMRLGFIWMIKLGISLSIFDAIAIFICALLDKKLDTGALIALTGLVFGIATTGKVAQRFGEKDEDTPILPNDTK